MKLLSDENGPKKLRQDFTEYEVVTVREKGWNGKKNGELLKLMLSDGVGALLTVDKNISRISVNIPLLCLCLTPTIIHTTR